MTDLPENPAATSQDSDSSQEAGGAGEGEVVSLEVEPNADMVRYVNPFYRFMTIVGAAIVAILGCTAVVITRSVDPPMPLSITGVATLVSVLLFVWYLLGMRCGLEVSPQQLTVTSKFAKKEISRRDVEWIELDTSLLGVIQPAGRSLILQLKDGTTQRVVGALPTEAQAFARSVAELQRQLGSPASSTDSRLDRLIQERFGAGPPVEERTGQIDWDERRLAMTNETGEADDAVETDQVDDGDEAHDAGESARSADSHDPATPLDDR